MSSKSVYDDKGNYIGGYKFYDDCEKLKDPVKIREKFINEVFIPVATEMLKNNKEFGSVTVACGSYYNDNASDEIHIKYLPSSEVNSNWDRLFSKEYNKIYKRDLEKSQEDYKDPSYVYWDVYDYGREEMKKTSLTEGGWYGYFGADFFVNAFISYCPEGASQEDNIQDAYAPFMIFKRDGDKIKSKFIGETMRIWK